MRNIIEELYYGNITPCDRDIIKGGTYSHLLHLVTRNEDDLMQTPCIYAPFGANIASKKGRRSACPFVFMVP